MEGQPKVSKAPYEIPVEGLHIGWDEAGNPDETTVFILHRDGKLIGTFLPHGALNERKFVSDVLPTPCCLDCTLSALLADYDRRNPT